MNRQNLLMDTAVIQGGQNTFQAGNKIWQCSVSGTSFAGMKDAGLRVF